MKKIEEMLYVATESKKNTIISVAVLLLVGYILGFIGIKLIYISDVKVDIIAWRKFKLLYLLFWYISIENFKKNII